MERIIIIGCGGSGKSTLARALGEKTGLPVVHLDQIFWSPGDWKHLEAAEFDALLAQEMEKPRWILDGNYGRTMEARLEKCDTVIWLDYNRFVCIAGWLKRVFRYWGTARPDMGPGCGKNSIRNSLPGSGPSTAKTAKNTKPFCNRRRARKSIFSKTAAS